MPAWKTSRHDQNQIEQLEFDWLYNRNKLNTEGSNMRLSAHDASFLYTETASGPMHGVGIVVLDGPARYEDIFQFYSERCSYPPKL